MKKLLVTILLISTTFASEQDKDQVPAQPRPLVEACKEKHEQEAVLKKVRAAEQDQKSMIAKIKQTWVNTKFPISIEKSFENVLICVGILSFIGGTASIVYQLIYNDLSNLTLV